MSGSTHEPADQRNLLYGKKVLKPAVPRLGADRGLSTAQSCRSCFLLYIVVLIKLSR